MKIINKTIISTEIYSAKDPENEWEKDQEYWAETLVDLSDWNMVTQLIHESDTFPINGTRIECKSMNSFVINEDYAKMADLFIKFKETGSLL